MCYITIGNKLTCTAAEFSNGGRAVTDENGVASMSVSLKTTGPVQIKATVLGPDAAVTFDLTGSGIVSLLECKVLMFAHSNTDYHHCCQLCGRSAADNGNNCWHCVIQTLQKADAH